MKWLVHQHREEYPTNVCGVSLVTTPEESQLLQAVVMTTTSCPSVPTLWCVRG